MWRYYGLLSLASRRKDRLGISVENLQPRTHIGRMIGARPVDDVEGGALERRTKLCDISWQARSLNGEHKVGVVGRRNSSLGHDWGNCRRFMSARRWARLHTHGLRAHPLRQLEFEIDSAEQDLVLEGFIELREQGPA